MIGLALDHAVTARLGKRAVAMLATLALAAGVDAQEPRIPLEQPRTHFAWPWQVSFDHIRRAMENRSYEAYQVRRVLDRSNPSVHTTKWIAVLEHLRHYAAQPGTEDAFTLEFNGIESRSLSEEDWNRRTKRYEQISGFLFHHQSFSVSDAKAAARNYAIHFLGVSQRANRPVYQFAVVPKVGDRPTWRVDLDSETGYPLYRAEHDADYKKVSEVVVQQFNPNYGGPDSARVMRQETSYATPQEAFVAAGLSNGRVPETSALPAGFELRSSRVHFHPLNNKAKVVLTYSDGIDKLFILAGYEGENPIPGNVIQFYKDDAGMAQWMFEERSVHYILAARATNDSIPAVAQAIYTQIVQAGTERRRR